MDLKTQKINDLILNAQKELDLHKKDKKYERLLQAAEKCWIAYILLIEKKFEVELKTSKSIYILSKKKKMLELYEKFKYLHIFHYEGMLEEWEARINIKDGIQTLKKLKI